VSGDALQHSIPDKHRKSPHREQKKSEGGPSGVRLRDGVEGDQGGFPRRGFAIGCWNVGAGMVGRILPGGRRTGAGRFAVPNRVPKYDKQRQTGFFEFVPVSALVSARQRGGFAPLSLHQKFPFPARMAETGSKTAWWVASLCPTTSTTQPLQTTRFRYGAK